MPCLVMFCLVAYGGMSPIVRVGYAIVFGLLG